MDNAGIRGKHQIGRTCGEANPAACTWMNVQGIIAVLDDAARGLVNDAFQRQVLVRQCFKAYVNWFSEVAELGMA